jgi:hypothetical protein
MIIEDDTFWLRVFITCGILAEDVAGITRW